MMMARPPLVAVAVAVQPLDHGSHPLRQVILTVSRARYSVVAARRLQVTADTEPQSKPKSSLRETAARAGPSNSSSQLRKCDCGVPAGKKRVTQKSAREGKQFYACAQDACGFFEWIEGEEGQSSTRPTPLIPAKRSIDASRPVSVIHLSVGSRDDIRDVFRIKPRCQRAIVGVKRMPFNVPLQRRGGIRGVAFGRVERARMKDVISLNGTRSLPRHLD